MGIEVKNVEGFRPTEEVKLLIVKILHTSYKKMKPMTKSELYNRALEIAAPKLIDEIGKS